MYMYEAVCDTAVLKFHFIQFIFLKDEKNNHVEDMFFNWYSMTKQNKYEKKNRYHTGRIMKYSNIQRKTAEMGLNAF